MKRILQYFLVCSTAMLVITFVAKAQTLPKVQVPVFKNTVYNIVKYGAKADGVTLNTSSINAAIKDCNKNGGGTVLIPAGLWITGPIELQSNVNLRVDKNALLQFTSDLSQFKLVAGNWEGLPSARNQSPISGTNLTNIAITGNGIIDGAGDAWRMVKKDKLNATQWQNFTSSGGVLSADKKTWYPSAGSLKGSEIKDPGVLKNGMTVNDFAEIKDYLRPNLLVLTNCKKVLLQDVTFQNSPAWCLHPLMCLDLTIDHIYAKNPFYAQNGDGIDVESCKNVVLKNSTFDVGDDGICVKSGRDAEGRKRNMPTENMLVTNCVVYHAHGGFVIGSEMSGGAKNILVSNCTFIGTDVGLRFKTTRGRGGIVENIYVENINMKNIAGEAILFDMYYAAKDPVPLAGEKRLPPVVETLPVSEETPQFRNFYVKNIVCNGAAKAIFVRGLPEMNIKNIFLKDMILQADEGLDCTEATGIHLSGITFLTAKTDPVLNISNSREITLDKIQYNKGAKRLLSISGSKSANIVVSNTDFSNAVSASEFTFGATEQSLKKIN